MSYIKGFDREQLMWFSWDDLVAADSIARIIDEFVNHLDLQKYKAKLSADEGQLLYDTGIFYKIYIYGSKKDNCLISSLL